MSVKAITSELGAEGDVMTYKNRYELFDGCWEEPWSELSKEQRQAWREDLMRSLIDEEEAGRRWDTYSTEQRQERADAYDAQHDPVISFVGNHDCLMDARMWFDMPDVTPKDAAMVLCRLDQLKREDPERIYVDGDRSSPDRYRLLLLVFEAEARTSPKHRTMMEWRATARERGLRYHSWIDKYVQFTGRDNAATSAKPDASQAEVKAVTEAEATKAKGGRPKAIDKKTKVLRKLITIMSTAKTIDLRALPGSSADLLDACGRIEKAKTGKTKLFATTEDTFKTWLNAAGYGFRVGRPSNDEANYWTHLCVETMAKIPPEVFP